MEALVSSQKNRLIWPLVYFLLVAFIPGHLFNWAVEWALAVVTTLGGILLYPRFHRSHPRLSLYGLVLVLLVTLVATLSYFVTLFHGQFLTGPRDLVEVFKVAMIYFSCTLGFSFGPIDLDRARKASAMVLLFSIACALIISFHPPVLTELVQALYGTTKTNISEFTVRLSIPFENPNFLGIFSTLSLSLALFFGAKPDFRLAVLAAVVAALTGSRTAWVTTLLIVLAYLLLRTGQMLAKRQLPSLPSVLVVGALVASGIYFAPNLVTTYQRLNDFMEVVTTLNLAQDDSYAERIALRGNANNLIAERPLIGWGALKYSDLSVVDNQYYTLLLRGGIFGTFLVVQLILVLFSLHLSRLHRWKRGRHALLLWGVVLIWMWTGSFADNIRIATLLTLMLASTASLSPGVLPLERVQAS